ncbi:TonB-dependent receptor [Thalassotalea sp. G20_0]|uniref:TonB-dependent receptor n=1 Tax=Thalassotalea sp. G20_0 TaxID=2821093 RepID=UPI001ADABF0C|nr:TonB-dependent receptor [Thalassotalea sp. G20_0]MBO9493532.1 TonB-dependent receptor [Thalassotalea sp. G20_0]
MNNNLFRPAVLALAISSSIYPMVAEAAGKVAGRLMTEGRQVALQGASVRLEELNLETSTNREGTFTFPVVKAGKYTLTVQYLGAETLARTVTVKDDQTSSEIFELAMAGATEEVLVVGHAANLNRALNQQRVADGIISAVNADAIGQLPDANVAEALRRVSGVSVEMDQGEGRKVSIRGLSPDLNSVSINGVMVPSPDSGDRAVNLDVVSSELLESLQVIKTLTPDMDADAIGGTVNIKSLSAFDRDGFFYKVSGDGSHHGDTGQNSPGLAATVSDIFSVGEGQDNFGVAGAFSWNKRQFGSENIETGGAWNFDNTPPLLDEVELRNYDIERERLGATLNVDYRPDNDNDLYLRTLYSEFKDTELRDRVTMAFAGGLAEGVTGALDGGEAQRELKDREEIQQIVSAVVGGSSRHREWTMEYSASFSHAEEKKPDSVESVFEATGITGNFSYTDGSQPVVVGPDDFYRASGYTFTEAEKSTAETDDQIVSVKLDLSKDFHWQNHPAMVKFGGKVSRRDKKASEDVWLVENINQPMTGFVNGGVDYSLSNFGPSVNPDAVRDVISGLPAVLDEEKSAIGDYQITEDIDAAYVMGKVDIDRWRFLTGIRYEGTEFTSRGFGYDKDNSVAIAKTSDKSYRHWLPAFHARYRINDHQLIRAAWTNSVVRPTFEQARPGYVVELGDKAEFGNPALNPTESSNLDLGIETYLGRAGVFSAFVFYKDLRNFIYTTDLGGTGEYAAYSEARVAVNGDSGKVYGLELAYSKQFSELPSPWNGLLLNTNATFTDSSADVAGVDGGNLVTRNVKLPGQSDITANVELGYDMDRFSLRLAANYKSHYLDEITRVSDSRYDLYVDDHTQIDLTSRYQVDDQVQVFFQVTNLNDAAFYKYTGSSAYNAQYEAYGRTYKLGLTLSNF